MGDDANNQIGVSGDGERVLPLLRDEATEVQGEVAESTVPCEFICGIAGSGKTYSVRERAAADPSWGLICSTTGISAINLGTTTLNSALRYFDTDSLRDAYLTGTLARRLREVRESHRRLVIDEVSMMDADQLSLIVRATMEANTFLSSHPPLGITLVGDFAQLPPVRARWAFESDEWSRFAASTTRLTKVWRQEQSHFLAALNAARRGDGAESADLLTQYGVEWHSALTLDFDGTTIVPRNDQVERYNRMALDRLPMKPFSVSSRRWGRQRGEWKQVPERSEFKTGAYVMLLSNSYDEERNMVHANGDCGHIVSFKYGEFQVELVRNHQVVNVGRLIRDAGQPSKPAGWDRTMGHGEWLPRPHWMPDRKRYVEGQIEYYPLRLAYASTVHKSQGLSLDSIQVDIRDHFFSSYSMCYVALSRVRTLEGLRIVGQRERFVTQCKADPRIKEWL